MEKNVAVTGLCLEVSDCHLLRERVRHVKVAIGSQSSSPSRRRLAKAPGVKETLEPVSGVVGSLEMGVEELPKGGVVKVALGTEVEEVLTPSTHSNFRKMTPPTVRF